MLKDIDELQEDPNCIRNVCLVAHIDHGKTSIADCLISTNGIISKVSAGKLRYLDCIEYEQKCGITIKSSSIALKYDKYLINLMDSPGHMDFSAEVSSGLRMVDGCVVVVDVVEGVCIQTRQVLRQAWNEGLVPCLLLNKLDKLFLNLGMSLNEAYNRLVQIVEQVNGVIASLWIEEQTRATTAVETPAAQVEDENYFFSPGKGNVVFASAAHGWGFTIADFVRAYSSKLKMAPQVLNKCLWGNWCYDQKTRKVHHGSSGSSNMFTKFVLSPIYQAYCAALGCNDTGRLNCTGGVADFDRVCKMAKSLGFEVPLRFSKHNDGSSLIAYFMSQWLPLSQVLLAVIVEQLPSPKMAQAKRVKQLLHCSQQRVKMAQCIAQCQSDPAAPLLAYVSKVFTVDLRHLPKTLKISSNENSDQQNLVLIAMTRIFSGQMRAGDTVRLLGPRYDSSQPAEHAVTLTIPRLFVLMGPYLMPISKVGAGMIFGIGIDMPPLKADHFVSHIVKTATITSEDDFGTFSKLFHRVSPVVRVAVEPVDSGDLCAFERALHLLYLSDPAVDISALSSGEHVIGTLGELHLARCLELLENNFAQVPLKSSKPIVQFHETIGMPVIPVDREYGSVVIERSSENPALFIVLRAIPLPELITQWLYQWQQQQRKSSDNFAAALEEQFEKFPQTSWQQEVPYIWSVGSRQCSTNLLLNNIPRIDKKNKFVQSIRESLVSAFQVACRSGPLCEEPLMGVAFQILDLGFSQQLVTLDALCHSPTINPPQSLSKTLESLNSHLATFLESPMATDVELESIVQSEPKIFALAKTAFRNALQVHQKLLYEGLYDTSIQVDCLNLGKVYAVLSKRRADIISEEINERSGSSLIRAYLPVVESIGFAEELSRKSSGAAHAQFSFSHWRILNIDPLFEPTTSEEIEEFGSCLPTNIALKYVNTVRKRKGLPVRDKIVESANKQRTLSKKK